MGVLVIFKLRCSSYSALCNRWTLACNFAISSKKSGYISLLLQRSMFHRQDQSSRSVLPGNYGQKWICNLCSVLQDPNFCTLSTGTMVLSFKIIFDCTETVYDNKFRLCDRFFQNCIFFFKDGIRYGAASLLFYRFKAGCAKQRFISASPNSHSLLVVSNSSAPSERTSPLRPCLTPVEDHSGSQIIVAMA